MRRTKIQRNPLERVVGSEPEVRSGAKLSALVGRARGLKTPVAEESGLDWSSLEVPRRVFCFFCEQEDHSLRSWKPLSTRVGKFHQFDRYCLVVALEGSGVVGVGGSLRTLAEGETLLIGPDERHYYLETSKRFSWLYLLFDSGGPESNYTAWANQTREISRKSRRLLNQLVEGYQSAVAPDKVFGLSLTLQDLLIELNQLPESHHEVEELSLVERVKHSIFTYVEERFTLDQLAEGMGMGTIPLKDEFRRITGETLGAYVRTVRLTHAGYLLRNRAASVAAVAEACGFRDGETFAQAFEAQYRVSPEKYVESVPPK